MSLTWISDPTTTVARHLRRDIRAHRREKGRGDHRFRYTDLKELHAGYLHPLGQEEEGPIHVVLTHHEDPVWQHWARHPENGWMLCDWYSDKQQAMAAAEQHNWEPVEEVPNGREPGIYVLAGWPKEINEPIDYTMSTHCTSKNVAITVADTYRAMGCVTSQEIVP